MRRLQRQGPNLGLRQFGMLHMLELLRRAQISGGALLQSSLHNAGHLAARASRFCTEHGQPKGKPVLGGEAIKWVQKTK